MDGYQKKLLERLQREELEDLLSAAPYPHIKTPERLETRDRTWGQVMRRA